MILLAVPAPQPIRNSSQYTVSSAMVTPPNLGTPSFDEYVRYLEGLGYRQRRKFLRHQVSPRLARFLYKFRSLVPSDATSVERMRDILVQCRLRLSSPAEFNDPFDMAGKLVVEGSPVEIRKTLAEIMKTLGIRWSDRKKQIDRIMSRADREGAFLMGQETLEKLVYRAGVCSFGGDPRSIPRSILMWSHYAANHEGLCLQFELARDPTTFAHALPVEYSNDYPVVNWVTGMENIMTVLLRKHEGWKYEREQRIIIPESAGKFINFRPAALSGIIIGCRASDSTVKQLRDLLTERSSRGFPLPKLYRAFRHKSKYGLVIKRAV